MGGNFQIIYNVIPGVLPLICMFYEYLIFLTFLCSILISLISPFQFFYFFFVLLFISPT
jgi:hypothetical protein